MSADIQENKKVRRGKANYLYSIVGVALVLFLLGILGWLVIYATTLADFFKENIEVQVIFNDATKDEKALKLQEILDKQWFAKETEFISKDRAEEIYKESVSEDFIQVLDYNPLYSSIKMNLRPEYVNTDSLIKIKNFIEQSNIVREVYYEKRLVDEMVDNIQKISIVLLLLSLLLIFAVVFLIDNTIRLAMFSNRFLIKTMQMVGATRRFIAKPFTKRSIINGVISSLIAIAGLLLTKFSVENWIPELSGIAANNKMFILCVGILIIGVLISFLSTNRSVLKYLKTQLDELY